ncbi:MAG: hypothetical protein AB1505_13560 [Candidatus Latescibacterota bacterium]
MTQDQGSVPTTPTAPSPPPHRILFGVHPLKVVFAMEYVLQGLANPFQGITYQPFFRHFRFDYGLDEAATQGMFSKSYLAWSFKPVIGFLIDAYGRTRTILTALLTLGVLGYLLTPLVDTGPLVFFGFMFALSVVMAATDVSVDRATVISGDEEARSSGRSRSTTVGLNQSICWTAVYGTGILAAVLGGWTAEHVSFKLLMPALAAVPLAVLLVVLLLPADRAATVPLRLSALAFWRGLNSGPILGVILFYFVFHFQPAIGPLWNNYLIESLHFTQTQIGLSDGAAYAGYFVGVLLFAWKGVHWQDRVGLRRIFRLYILASVLINLTQYVLVDPWFSAVTGALHEALPFLSADTVRVGYLATYSGLQAVGASLIRMSTFSLVGAVIPVAAAGSLFAGFMSVANLAYSFSYGSGAWLYSHGTEYGLVRSVQESLFGVAAAPGDELTIRMLILVGSLAYLLSFVAVHVLPDREHTRAAEGTAGDYPGPERWGVLGSGVRRTVDALALAGGSVFVLGAVFYWDLDPISATLIAFFGFTMLRKAVLDALLRRV